MSERLNSTDEALMMLIVEHKFPMWYRYEAKHASEPSVDEGNKRSIDDTKDKQLAHELDQYDKYVALFKEARRMGGYQEEWDDWVKRRCLIEERRTRKETDDAIAATYASDDEITAGSQSQSRVYSPGLLRRLCESDYGNVEQEEM